MDRSTGASIGIRSCPAKAVPEVGLNRRFGYFKLSEKLRQAQASTWDGYHAMTLPVASQANIGGAASAVAIASARGYADKLLPGIAVALAGYAVGNYFGFGMGMLARTLLGS